MDNRKFNGRRRPKPRCYAFTCPHCGAEPGQNCDPRNISGNTSICWQRSSMVTTVPPSSPARSEPRPVHYIRGGLASAACRKKAHASCTGMLRYKYGMGEVKCGCTCHLPKENQENDVYYFSLPQNNEE